MTGERIRILQEIQESLNTTRRIGRKDDPIVLYPNEIRELTSAVRELDLVLKWVAEYAGDRARELVGREVEDERAFVLAVERLYED